MSVFCFFFFNDTATTEIYTLSLHDALPISNAPVQVRFDNFNVETSETLQSSFTVTCAGLLCDFDATASSDPTAVTAYEWSDRKSTRLNSSHANLVCRVLFVKKKYFLM